MDKLLDAYDFINHYKKRNKPVPQDVLDEAREAEIYWLRQELTTAFQEHIQPILDKIESEFTLVCEHIPSESASLFISREKDIISLLDDAVCLSNSEEDTGTVEVASEPEDIDVDEIVEVDDEIADTDVSEHRAGKAKSIGFTVRFADGKVISRSNAKDTMIDAFQYIGLDKVATFMDRTFKGFHLVDRRKRMDKGGVWQQAVEDGWYVYTNMSNDTKKIMIQRVANSLGIKLTITDNVESGLFSSQSKSEGRKQRTLYSLNGRSPKDKRNSVLDVVKTYAATRPNATFNEMLRNFPDKLQGSYGVIKTLDELDERRRRGQQVDNRYFLDPRDILMSSDGVEYAVCNQWGDQFHQFQEHVKNFGWTLTEIK